MRTIRIILYTVVLCFAAISCEKSDSQDVTDIELKPLEMSPSTKGLVEENNKFAYRLLDKVIQQQDGSFMVSPLSCSIALGLLAEYLDEGGKEYDAITKMLGFEGYYRSDLREYFHTMMFNLPTLSKTTRVLLANMMVYDSDINKASGLGGVAEQYYDAIVKGFSFKNSKKVASFINDWADDKTNGKIREVITPGEVSMNGQDIIMSNALYFNGKWKIPFDAKNTFSSVFTRADGSDSKVKMMKMTDYSDDKAFWLERKTEYNALSLFYGNMAFKMTIFLPNEGYSVSDVTSSLLSNPVQQFSVVDLKELQIPRFGTNSKVFLSGVLNEMCDNALDGKLIYQVSAMNTNESGTEAATVTVIEYTTGIKEDITFIADHTFLFLIQELSTGVILFAGVYDGD